MKRSLPAMISSIDFEVGIEVLSDHAEPPFLLLVQGNYFAVAEEHVLDVFEQLFLYGGWTFTNILTLVCILSL